MLPTRIEIINFKSFVSTSLDFDFSSALIVGEKDGNENRSNGAGKTSCLEMITFALFGETNDKNADDIVRRGQIACEVILYFSHDNENYKIKRTRNARYSKMTTEFYKQNEAGEWENKSGDTNKLTDATIQATIKSNYSIFTNSSYFIQNSFFEFAEGTFSTRQTLLGSLLNIDIWNKYQKAAKFKFDEITGQTEALKLRLEETKQSAEHLVQVKDRLAEITKQLADLVLKEQIIESEIIVLEKQISANSAIDIETNQYNSLSQIFKDHSDKIIKHNKELNNKDLELLGAQEHLEKNKKAAIQLNIEIEELSDSIKKQNITQLKDSIVKMEQALLEGKSKQRNLALQIENLTNFDTCNLCGHAWADPNIKHLECSKKQEELTILEAKLVRAQIKLADTRKELDQCRAAELEFEKLKVRINSLNSICEMGQQKIDTIRKDISSLNSTISQLEIAATDVSVKLKALSPIDKSSNISLNTTLCAKKDERRDILGQTKTLTFEQGGLSQKEKGLEAEVATNNRTLNKIIELNKDATVYGKLTKAFGRDGVQAIIIDNVIEEITRVANEWLVEFCDEPTYINFITQKQSTKGDWKETLDIAISTTTGASKFESLSGGERFRVGFAIRLALSALQARRMGGETQILLLDEVSTSLDASGLEMFVSIIRKLERSLKVIVITHDDKLKEAFDTIITVKKTAQGSEINV